MTFTEQIVNYLAGVVILGGLGLAFALYSVKHVLCGHSSELNVIPWPTFLACFFFSSAALVLGCFLPPPPPPPPPPAPLAPPAAPPELAGGFDAAAPFFYKSGGSVVNTRVKTSFS